MTESSRNNTFVPGECVNQLPAIIPTIYLHLLKSQANVWLVSSIRVLTNFIFIICLYLFKLSESEEFNSVIVFVIQLLKT